MNKELRISTPVGTIVIEKKGTDYPGVYISIVNKKEEDELVSCIEYDCLKKCIQNCLYEKDKDEPVQIIEYHF